MIPSTTYKLRAPGASDHAIYFTIAGKPIQALFVNSKEMQSFQWISALMTAYTRQLKAGVHIDSIVRDMTDTFDPNGSYIIPDGSGRQVNSIVHHLGIILEGHTIND